MPEPLFLTSRSAASNRAAIVAEDGDSVWLYLTGPGSTRPERDCWLLNTPSAASEPDPERYRSEGLPPPAPAEIIDPKGVQKAPEPKRWNFLWSPNGDAVAVAVDDIVIGVVAVAEARGFSRHLLRSGPWGNAWDPDVVARLCR